MSLFEPIDFAAADFGDFFDELPLWSAPFGLSLLDRVPLRAQQTVLDLGAGTGFLAIELAERSWFLAGVEARGHSGTRGRDIRRPGSGTQ